MDLDHYAVIANGFLPAAVPLARLSDPYYTPWEAAVHSLVDLLRRGALRPAVRALPLLATDRLQSGDEWRRAYVVLCFLAQAYVWGGFAPEAVLPKSLAVPLVAVAAHLELPPVATYAALNLWNFRVDNDDGDTPFDDPDRLHALHTFTGTESESWFFMVSTAIECRAASMLPVLARELDALDRGTDDADALRTATAALHQFVECMAALGRLLDRMHEGCEPAVFYHQIRPFLGGSRGSPELPRGVFYEGVTTSDDDGGVEDTVAGAPGTWHQFCGPSNGQSSLLPFFDAVLGVQHGRPDDDDPANPANHANPDNFHQHVRVYMPGPHRRLLAAVAARASVRARVVALGVRDDDDSVALLSAFRAATDALAAFRGKHLAIVARYIVLPAKQAAARRAQKAAAIEDKDDKELKGTGGTSLLLFLKQARDETLEAGVF